MLFGTAVSTTLKQASTPTEFVCLELAGAGLGMGLGKWTGARLDDDGGRPEWTWEMEPVAGTVLNDLQRYPSHVATGKSNCIGGRA